MIRITKKDLMSPKKILLIRVASFFLALLIGTIAIAITKNNVFSAYKYIIQGCYMNDSGSFSKMRFRQTIETAVPLLCCALAIAPCFKMKFWNIGAEGQITAGAIFATLAAFTFPNMPKVLLLPLMFVFAAFGGALWAFFPAFFKAKFNTNETLFTLMMNYTVLGIAGWLQGGPWESTAGSQIARDLPKNALLPKVMFANMGWIVAIVLTVFMFFYMNYTKHGYEIAVIGDSENTAKYAGMNVGKIMIRTMLLSGMICGICGCLLVANPLGGKLTKNIAGGRGFTAITVAWLSQLNPFAMILISIVLAILTNGARNLQSLTGIPLAISDIITGILLFCMLGCEFFINYKIIFKKKEAANV